MKTTFNIIFLDIPPPPPNLAEVSYEQPLIKVPDIIKPASDQNHCFQHNIYCKTDLKGSFSKIAQL